MKKYKVGKLEINKEYSLKGKIVRYIGRGKNTSQYMFRDNVSGKIIFEKDLEQWIENREPQMKEEIIYVE